VDVLVVGGFFVEIDSYAIAISSYADSTSGNSMGLILDARGFIFLESIAYWKAVTVTQDQDANSTSSFVGRLWSDLRYAVSEALSKELDWSKFVR